MNITIKINTGNAAFDDGNADFEIARILREIALAYERNGNAPDKLYDVNGNAVGTHRATGRR